MEKREIDLTVSCYGKVKDVKYDVVILPWGATEPHNLHLPYLTACRMTLPWMPPLWRWNVPACAAW